MSAERVDLFLGQRHLVDFSYVDVVGNATERLVDVVDGWRACGHGYVFGWCRGVRDWRTFRNDRVQVWRVRGGPPVRKENLLEELKRLTDLRMPQLGDPPVRSGQTNSRPALVLPSMAASSVDELVAMVGILVFVARADGRVASDEAETLQRCISTWGRSLARAEDLQGVASSTVSREEFVDALHVLSSSPRDVREAVFVGALAVADASDGVREDEAAVLSQVAAMFGLPWDVSSLWRLSTA